MARVKVTEPATGVELEVEDDSPQARVWAKSNPAKAPAKRAEAKSDNK